LRRAAAALAALTLVRLAFAALLPLTPDEAYYWVWSRALAPGYVDHPPMVALWIRAGTMLCGETAFGVRLFGPLSAAATTLFLADAARLLFPDRRAGVVAGLLWNATLLIGAGSVTMTPDTPLLFFWCATLWAAVRLATGSPIWWLPTGLFAGAALSSKYTAALLWFGIGIWVLSAPSRRRWLRAPWPWLGALLGLAIFLPVLLWNADHHWVSFLKQGGRVGDWQPARALGFLAELVGGQIGLATPGVWLLSLAGAVALFRTPGPGRGLLLGLMVPPALVFTQHALGDRVQGNWPAILYPAGVIGVNALRDPRWQRLIRPSAALGFTLTAIVLLHAWTGFLPLPPGADPAARQLAGWPELVAALDAQRRQQNASYVIAEEYALISELAWQAPPDMPVLGIEPRLGPMTLPRQPLPGRTGILIRAEHRFDEIDPATWSSAVPLGFVDRVGARGTVERYRIWRVTGLVEATALPARGIAPVF
jgi:4-amino-4-deoxy-L-arabinose transferase-like glycosyltransferase